MLALVKFEAAPGKVELREVPEPVAKAGDVKIAVRATGICGTDIHHYDNEYPSRPPVVLGHEVAGTIVEVGSDVATLHVGDRVTATPFAVTCGRCRYCREGEVGLCPERIAFGSFMDGAFAPYLVLPAGAVLRLPDNATYEVGAMSEPLANGVKAVCEASHIVPGDVVLVMGPGPIGMLAGLLAKAQGATVVMVGTSADAQRLETAGSLGIDCTLRVDTDDVPRAVDGLTHGEGAALVLECSGAPQAVNAAFPLVRKHGQITQMGLAGKPFEVAYDQIVMRDIRVVGSFGNSLRSWKRVLELLRDEALPLAALVSAVLPLSRWEEAFAMVRRKDGMKVMLRPD